MRRLGLGRHQDYLCLDYVVAYMDWSCHTEFPAQAGYHTMSKLSRYLLRTRAYAHHAINPFALRRVVAIECGLVATMTPYSDKPLSDTRQDTIALLPRLLTTHEKGRVSDPVYRYFLSAAEREQMRDKDDPFCSAMLACVI